MLTRRVLFVLPVLLAIVLLGRAGDAQSQANAGAVVTVVSANGKHRFNVELAETPVQQEQGLMFRRAMAEDAGMLFIFPATAPQTFWMRNTLIPLDMLFITADGRIADIHERAVPMSDATITSKVPVLAVLELNGGTVSRLGIKLGDLVRHAAFGTAPPG